MAIPAAALPLLWPLLQALEVHAPAVRPYAPAIAAQIDHETGCGWSRVKCWSPRAELRTAREQGVGLAQITRVFGRFDALAELRAKHPVTLAGVDWDTPRLYQPEVQLTLLALKQADTYARLRHLTPLPYERLTLFIVGHNRGVGGLIAEQAACRARPGCDPQRWWGHIEHTCTASRRPLYAGRSACDISRHYPRDILHRRLPAYRAHFDARGWAYRLPDPA